MTSPTHSSPIREATFSILLRGAEVRVSQVSGQVEELLGYSAEAFCSGTRSLPALIHADDQDIVELLFSPTAALASGACNLRVRQASGSILCVKGQYRHEAEADGRLLSLTLQDVKSLPRTMADVTGMPYAMSVMENTEDYVYFKDRNHVFTGASQTLVAFCHPAEHWTDLIGRTDYDVFPEDLADEYYRLEKQVFAGLEVAAEIQPIRRKDGTAGWVDNRKYPIRDASGAIVGLHGIARDITEATLATAALRESESRARATIDASPVPMATNDDAMRITSLNPAFTAAFGYELADIPTLADWWPKAYPDAEYRQQVAESWGRELARSAEAGTPFAPIELTIRCKDGTDRLALVRAVPLGGSFRGEHLVVLQDVTADRHAAQALRTSEERLRFALDGSGAGAWDWDLSSGAVNYSPRWAEMLGYAPEEIAPALTEWSRLAHPDDLPRVLADVQLHLDGRTPVSSNEYRMRCKDGSWKWILGRGLVVARDASGTPLRMIGTHSDITERKQAELALRRSKEALDEAQRLAHIGSWELDLATGKVVLSDELCHIYGVDIAIASSSIEHHPSLYTPASWDRLLAAMTQTMTTGLPYEMELERILTDGARGWLWVRGECVRDEQGAITGLRGVAQDVTDRKRAEEVLRLNDVVIRSISQGVIVTGPDRLIVSANVAFCAITGYDAAEVIGRDCKFLVGPETDPQTTDAIRKALAAARPYAGEIRNHRKDGTPFWNELTITPVFDPSGALTHFIGVTQDISSRKALEQERAGIAAQLRQAQRLETVGTLAAGIAHDFNNILAAIVGNAELALSELGEVHAAREYLAEIGQASGRAKTLVQQVLTFSRQQQQERQPLALGALAHEVTALLRATIPTTVQIVTSVEGDTALMLGDVSQLHQVLVNLCTNGWHALEDRPGRIEVRVGSTMLSAKEASEIGELLPGSHVYLSVRDDGKGMDAEILRRIYDPFFTTKGPGKGTGLGLSVVHGIVRAHEGAMRVVSAPGKGTTFTLFFPVVGTAEVAEPTRTPVAAPTELLSGRVLYIDDEDMLVRVATRTLQRLGYEVAGFVNPAEALATFARDAGGFDVAFTDMNMPETDGLAVAKALLRLRPDLPIVLVSGSITDELRQAAEAVGITGVLCKPFSMQELRESLPRRAIG